MNEYAKGILRHDLERIPEWLNEADELFKSGRYAEACGSLEGSLKVIRVNLEFALNLGKTAYDPAYILAAATGANEKTAVAAAV